MGSGKSLVGEGEWDFECMSRVVVLDVCVWVLVCWGAVSPASLVAGKGGNGVRGATHWLSSHQALPKCRNES